MSTESAKRLSLVARRCLERLHELEKHLFTEHQSVVQERRHYEAETLERGYFKAGYLQALKDVRELIDSGEFPTGKLDSDGGPRRRSEIPATEPAPAIPGE